MEAIKILDKVDQYIVIQHYINHVQYWKIANELYYSEEAIRKRARKALTVLCDVIDIVISERKKKK